MSLLRLLSPSPSHNLYPMYRVMDRNKSDKRLYPVSHFWSDKLPLKIEEGREYFFSPVLRNFGKSFPVCGSLLWFDFDNPDFDPSVLALPPSLLIFSGFGWHVYYHLSQNCLASDLGRFVSFLIPVLGSDRACSDPERFMRLPGSYNHKGSSPVLSFISPASTFVTYSLLEVSNAYGVSLFPSIE